MKIVVSFLKEGVYDFAQCSCLVQHLSLKNGKTRVEYKGKGQTHKDAAAVRTQARSKMAFILGVGRKTARQPHGRLATTFGFYIQP